MAFTVLADSGAIFIGLLARAVFDGSGVDLGNNAEDSLILMVERFMPIVFIGIYIAVVLSAIMSTIDSLLVVASSAISRDIYQKMLNPELKQENLSRMSRIFTVVMALLALSISMIVAISVPDRTVFWFVIFGWSGISATFCPMIILSLFWKNYTARGALASMIAGFCSIPIFKFLVVDIPTIGPYFNNMEEMLPSFIMSFIAGFLFSKSGKKEFSKLNRE